MSLKRHLLVMAVLCVSAAWTFAQAPDAAKPAAAKPAAATPAAAPVDDADAPAPDGKKHTSLGVRQLRVQQLVFELRKKFDELAKSKAIEEDQRQRIYEALANVEKSGLQADVAKIVALLDAKEFTDADSGQQAVIIQLKLLIDILTKDQDEREKQMQQLEEYKKILNELKKDENQQKTATERVAAKEKSLANLDAQIKAVEELIVREKKVIDNTIKARGEGIQKLDPVADEQRGVRNSTEKLAKDIAGQGDPDAAEGMPGEGKPGEGKPGEGKPGEGKPGEGKPGEGKPEEGKPGEGKPEEGKPGEGKPEEGKPEEGKPGEGKPGEGGMGGEGKPGEGKPGEGGMGGESGKKEQAPGTEQPGQKPLEKAAEHQKAAETNLGKGKGKAAEADEHKAVAELEKAKTELKNERDRIASLSPEEFERMAAKQDRTGEKTNDLSKQMAKDEADKAKSGGGMGGMGEGDGEPTPGKKSVEQAQKEMQQAAETLRRQFPKQAKGNQKKAVDKLQEALDEIERKLAQLREEMQQERLAALEAHFRQMLEIQKPVTISTSKMEQVRSQRPWTRTELLDLTKLAVKEKELSAMAQKGLDIIVEDGTSVVFPRVVEQLRDDLTSVQKLLEARNAGSYTQAMQREIESTLRELIEALEQAQKQSENENESPPSDSPPSDEDPPLLPNSAELKLLKAAQLRVNRRTKSFDDIRPDGDLEPVLREEVKKITRQQENVVEMTRAMIERN